MPEYKIVIFGSGGVGKSALIARLTKGKFLEKYDPTIEDSYKKEIIIDGRPCTLDILDTSGTEQFTAMRDLYMKNGDGFILVYSITDATSLAYTAEIFQSLVRTRQKYHFPLILVGNKCDDVENREVPRTDGEQYAMQYNSTFCEASARNNIHVYEIFEDIAKQIKIEAQLAFHRSEKENKRWYADRGTSICCFM